MESNISPKDTSKSLPVGGRSPLQSLGMPGVHRKTLQSMNLIESPISVV
jgi:hypothetical protein